MKLSAPKKRRTPAFMTWVTLLIIVAAVSGYYSLRSAMAPIGGAKADAISAPDMRGAAMYQARLAVAE